MGWLFQCGNDAEGSVFLVLPSGTCTIDPTWLIGSFWLLRFKSITTLHYYFRDELLDTNEAAVE